MKQLKMWTSESFTFSSLNTISMPRKDLTTLIFLSVNFPHCLRIFKIAFLSFTLCICVCVQFFEVYSVFKEEYTQFVWEMKRLQFWAAFLCWASLVTQLVTNLPVMEETWVWSLGWEDSLEKGKATTTHSSILAWRIPWTVYSPWGCKQPDTTEWLSLFF